MNDVKVGVAGRCHVEVKTSKDAIFQRTLFRCNRICSKDNRFAAIIEKCHWSLQLGLHDMFAVCMLSWPHRRQEHSHLVHYCLKKASAYSISSSMVPSDLSLMNLKR